MEQVNGGVSIGAKFVSFIRGRNVRIKSINIRFCLLCMCMVFIVTGCARETYHRGYKISPPMIEQVNKGMTSQEAREFLGSPSLVSDLGGKAFYYISSTFEKRVPFGEKEIDRQVIALYFSDKNDKVVRVAHYGIKDGVIVDHTTETTHKSGGDINILQQIFSNIGRFNSN